MVQSPAPRASALRQRGYYPDEDLRRAAFATELMPRWRLRLRGETRGSLPEGGPLMPVIEHHRIWKSALRRTSRTGADKEVDCNVLGGQLLKPRDQGSSDSTEKRAAPSPA